MPNTRTIVLDFLYCNFRSVLKIVRYTHRNPANIVLHCIGAPLYGTGIAIIATDAFGASWPQGAGLIIAAVSLFVAGHAIEGNVGSMTPVLLARLLLRTLASKRRNSVQNRVHL